MKTPDLFVVTRWLSCLLLLVGGVAAAGQTHPGAAKFAHDVAARHGLSEQHVLDILGQAERQQSILDAISRPAESKPWKDYRPIFLTAARIDGGVAFFDGNRALLKRIADKYGVDPAYIVAIIGVETSYGVNIGKYRVLDALATLAFYYPPRQTFFRGELEKLLTLPEHQLPMPIIDLKGSYAGAMGWGQFMPSSIAAYARDEDGDGHINLYDSLPDIIGSVANYLSEHGWKRGAPVAISAQVAVNAKPVVTEKSKPIYTVGKLEALGYAPTGSVAAATAATLLQLDGSQGQESWLTFGNFQVITRYNRSPLYAMAVTQLANAIRDGSLEVPAKSAGNAPAPAVSASAPP
ncbi:MAG TPA: lytic murein transglycosylase B [Rhodanobacteraceae bacterium]|nr:lytic murein transglycosylase B [Rhodanobacteraceae bacterium]